MLKSKLNVVVTAANKECEGSITLDPLLMDAAELYPYERVEVNARNGESRIVTYVLKGYRGSGQVEMNGGAANFFKAGDEVHVNCFAIVDVKNHLPCDGIKYTKEATIVKTNKNNKVI